VCGAAGNTGSAVVESLLNSGAKVHVRAGVRHVTEGRALELKKKGAELVQMDLNDVKSIRKALQGVDRVWVAPPNPSKVNSKPYDRIQLAVNVMDEAKAAGVSFLLLGSAASADAEAALFHREFRLAERHLIVLGLHYCILRMAVFMDNIVMFKEPLRPPSNTLALPLGDGAYCPVAVPDIGRMAASILIHYNRHHHSIYTITGPQALTGPDMSAALSRVLGRQIRYADLSKDDALKLLKPFMPEWQVLGLLELFDLFEQNAAKTPSADYNKVLGGRQAIDFESYMRSLRTAGVLDV